MKDKREVLATFKAKLKEDGQEVEKEFAIVAPSVLDYREARKVYNTTFAGVINSGGFLRERTEEILRAQNIWNDAKQTQLADVNNKINAAEKRLAAGGFALGEARKLAIQMRIWRSEQVGLLAPHADFAGQSAQGQADNEQFNYLVSACTVYNDTKQPVFESMADYLNRATEDIALKAAQTLGKELRGIDKDYVRNLPENRFLKSFKFVDENLSLVDKDGNLVDEDGNRVNERGQLVNDKGEPIDGDGTRFDDSGDFLVEFKPFLDEDGNTVDATWDYGLNKKKSESNDKE